MSQDLATLRVNVDATQATRNAEQLGRALDRTGDQATETARQLSDVDRAAVRAATGLQASAAAAQMSGARLATSGRQVATFAAQLAATGHVSVRTASDLAAASVAMGAAFGPGSIAALALVGFASNAIGAWSDMREEAKRTAEEWKKSLAEMVNASDWKEMGRLSRTLFEGTPINEFADGLAAAEERLAALRKQTAEMGVAGGLSRVFNAAPIREAEAEVERLRKKLDEVRSLILSPMNAARSTSAPLPIVITAQRDARDERAAWEDARRRAEERKQWEDEATLRAIRLGEARFVAEHGGLPPAGTATRLGIETPGILRENIGRVLGRKETAATNKDGVGKLDFVQQAKLDAVAIVAIERKAMEERQAIMENYLRETQTAFASFFRNILTEGKLSFHDLAKSLRDTMLSVVSELASKRLMEAILGGPRASTADRAEDAERKGMPRLPDSGGLRLARDLLASPVGKLVGVGALVAGLFSARRRLPRMQHVTLSPSQAAEWDRLRAFERQTKEAATGDRVRVAVGSAVQENTAIQMLGYFDSLRKAAWEQVALQRQMVALLGAGGLAAGVNTTLGRDVQLMRLASGVAVVR